VVTHVYSSAGSFVVTLTVTDNNGATSIANPVTVVVTTSTPSNQAPIVNAGPDVSGSVGSTVHLEGSVSDDGLPGSPGSLTIAWSLVSGPATPSWPLGDDNQAHAHVVFPAAGTYVLRLTVSDGALSSSDDVTVTIASAPDVEAPSVPTGLAAAAISTSQVNLSWGASSDNTAVAGYRVFRNGSAVGTSTTTSYADAGLASNTLYTYTVSAYDGASPPNESAPSLPVDATTRAPAPAPTVSLVASPVSVPFKGISQLTWSSTNATSCRASGAWTGTRPLSGTEATKSLTKSSSFTLSCTGTGGTTNATVQVNVTR